jgi:hypothetical protein
MDLGSTTQPPSRFPSLSALLALLRLLRLLLWSFLSPPFALPLPRVLLQSQLLLLLLVMLLLPRCHCRCLLFPPPSRSLLRSLRLCAVALRSSPFALPPRLRLRFRAVLLGYTCAVCGVAVCAAWFYVDDVGVW